MIKLTDVQRDEIRKKRAEGMTVMAIAVEYNTSLSTVTRIVNEKYAENIRKQQNARYHRQKAEKEALIKELEELREKTGKKEKDA